MKIARAIVFSATLLAAGGVLAAAVEEGRLLLRGSDRVAADPARAFHLFSGAAQKGDPQAAYYLGMMYKNGQAMVPGSACFHPEAASRRRGLTPDGVRPLVGPAGGESQAAAHWLEFAAKRQNPAAMYALAQLYLAGDGVKRDDQSARRWIEKAADLEYPEAVMAMAIGLRDGSMGFERNPALAETQMRFANRTFKPSTSGM